MKDETTIIIYNDNDLNNNIDINNNNTDTIDSNNNNNNSNNNINQLNNKYRIKKKMNQFKLVHSILRESFARGNLFLRNSSQGSINFGSKFRLYTSSTYKQFKQSNNNSSNNSNNSNNNGGSNYSNGKNTYSNNKKYALGVLISPTFLVSSNNTTTTTATVPTENNIEFNNKSHYSTSSSSSDASSTTTTTPTNTTKEFTNIIEPIENNDESSTTTTSTTTTTTTSNEIANESNESSTAQEQEPMIVEESNNNTSIDSMISEGDSQILNNTSKDSLVEQEDALHFHSGVCIIPHPNKRHKGGEDAYFISQDLKVLGVADGVGGWGDVGIDPSEYSNTLMEGSKIASNSISVSRDPLTIMEQGYIFSQDVKGSSTCCIVVLGGRNLLSANLGDSGFLVIRNSEVIFRTREQQHAFNMPYQLGTQSIDRPIHSIIANFPVEKGDLIIMGTDGVFDNLFDEEILEIGEKNYGEPQTIARAVAKRAFEVGCSTTTYTPFAKNAGNNGYIYNGGKLDDITVIVGIVSDAPPTPFKADMLLLDEIFTP
ncbi:hypothetical protein CYY_006356 [Polysphondylium violaceum]|uniref:PPM-type phosphatase domain-containing protein n=1 Tax=Polysphondylium violaceum TaxID=133409 RepID=A0A8J4PS04_9MYCE|nr:hypothetical protein CYY_006356 [Polysphondylium violaceum]